MTRVGVIVGSLRKESFSKKVALQVMELFPSNYETELVEIGNLPLYNQDFDDHKDVPEAYTIFRSQIKSVDSIVFVTPEYNRSVPGVLKNAIDVGSRPKAESVWNNKSAGIISVSPGALSAFGANHHLRQSLVFFNMSVVQQPEVYIGQVATLLNEKGRIQQQSTIHLLQTFIDALVHLTEK